MRAGRWSALIVCAAALIAYAGPRTSAQAADCKGVNVLTPAEKADGWTLHWLNEKKVLEFERWTPEWNTLRDSGKWKSAPDYGKAKTGRIAIQDHGSIFWFRNVKIRPLAE